MFLVNCYAYLDSATPATKGLLPRDNTLSCGLQWLLLFARGGKFSIAEIGLVASKDLKARAEPWLSWLVEAKTQTVHQGSPWELRLGQRVVIYYVCMLGSEGRQDLCMRERARPQKIGRAHV